MIGSCEVETGKDLRTFYERHCLDCRPRAHAGSFRGLCLSSSQNTLVYLHEQVDVVASRPFCSQHHVLRELSSTVNHRLPKKSPFHKALHPLHKQHTESRASYFCKHGLSWHSCIASYTLSTFSWPISAAFSQNPVRISASAS